MIVEGRGKVGYVGGLIALGDTSESATVFETCSTKLVVYRRGLVTFCEATVSYSRHVKFRVADWKLNGAQ